LYNLGQMDNEQKLRLIQKLSGLTQEKLASLLGVSFATLNSWINGKSVPRKKAEEAINALYREYTGQKVIPPSLLEAKKQVLAGKKREYKSVLAKIVKNPDIYDQFMLSLTYNTNSIEGSTLTEPETAAILFQNVALPDKDLIEQLEVKNHQAALRYLVKHLGSGSPKINEAFILKLHGILMNGIREDAGFYRRHAVRIAGANIPTANHVKIPALMTILSREINNREKDAIAHVSLVHSRFEQIHPFSDGNGRVGRLLMHAMLLLKNLPPAVIKQEKKRFYYSYLARAQQKNDLVLLEDFVCDAVMGGFEIMERKGT